jgi:hypothetical protein
MNAGYQGTRCPPDGASAPPDDAQFLAALEDCTLPPDCFNHAAHVRAGYLYLRRAPFPQATAAMCATLERYTRALGKGDRYHEPITVAYMALINAQLRRQGDGGDWEHFRARNPQLLRSDALLAG